MHERDTTKMTGKSRNVGGREGRGNRRRTRERIESADVSTVQAKWPKWSATVGNGPIDAPYIAARYCLGLPFLPPSLPFLLPSSLRVLSLSFTAIPTSASDFRFEPASPCGGETRLSNSPVSRHVITRKRIGKDVKR